MTLKEKKVLVRVKMLKRGLTWKKLADEIGVGESAVRVVFHYKSKRVQDFLNKRLRLPKNFWNDIEFNNKNRRLLRNQ